jgi:hypothetical protein
LDIDYGQPVAVIQKRLELLRMLGIRSLQWTLLLSPALWAPLLVVGFKGVLGVDAYQAFGVPYLLANLAVGLAVIPLGLWVVKKLGGRIGASPVMRRVMGDLAGYNLKAAMEFVGSVEEFERDRA